MCVQRAIYLMNVERLPLDEAKSKAMQETRSCIVRVPSGRVGGMIALHQSPLNSWTWGKPDEE